MKNLVYLLLAIFVATLSITNHSNKLVLSCQGTQEFTRSKFNNEQISLLREEMASLIKEGNFPILIEGNRNVAWLYLNDPLGRDYPDVDFESDYFDVIMDLFPLKINHQLKKNLKKGNREFFEALGIEYLIEDGEVISKIDYEKFEKFMFWDEMLVKNLSKSWFLSAFSLHFLCYKNGLLNTIDHYVYLLSWKHTKMKAIPGNINPREIASNPATEAISASTIKAKAEYLKIGKWYSS